LHGLLGGISAKLGGNSILSGAASGAAMEGLQPMLDTFLKDHPEEYPEIFEGVKDLGKLKSAYSIAGFIWFYCEKRYENRPDSIGYDTWLEHEIIGGQND
uniref:hypothetical protein n=1 Tax=Dialister sp. TaxID=1955814 RepID=UPI0040296253